MKCTCCESEMQAGSIQVRVPGETYLMRLSTGASFHPADGSEPIEILEEAECTLRCPACRTVLLVSKRGAVGQLLREMIGATGTTNSTLKPRGEVLVGGRVCPAKAESGLIPKGREVLVVEASVVELIVRTKLV